MRRRHLEALRPVCPVCRTAGGGENPLLLADVRREEGDHVVEGTLRCPSPSCQREYPILDGIPLLIANLRSYVAGAIDQINAREDLDATTESLLGDCCGPGSSYDATRQHLSTYAWDHYGDLDPEETGAESVLDPSDPSSIAAWSWQARSPKAPSWISAAPWAAPPSSWPRGRAVPSWGSTLATPCSGWLPEPFARDGSAILGAAWGWSTTGATSPSASPTRSTWISGPATPWPSPSRPGPSPPWWA